MIWSNNECVFVRDLSDHTLQMIFNLWWASMNVASKWPIVWNNSIYGPLWRFYLHCGILHTGSPGILCILCQQFLRHPSEHGTSSMEKHLLVKAHITKFNELAESEVCEWTSSRGNETALAILRRQGSWRITILSSPRKFILDIQVWSIWTELTDKMLQTRSEGLWNFKISPRHVESLPHGRICFGLSSMEQ